MNQAVVSLIKPEMPKKWQEILSDVITDPKELLRILELNNEGCAALCREPLHDIRYNPAFYYVF
ncbi:MAG: hypothetical protein MK321_05055 [Pseudomonadales bacterium]|nr:hypothetical protein [Pseudomonadales bacterium]HAC87138.1 hypothetical protein [Gammaproteobacteria bacterium]HAD72623.1 hypothetical protein [Gammaproteobacteria bacterium]